MRCVYNASPNRNFSVIWHDNTLYYESYVSNLLFDSTYSIFTLHTFACLFSLPSRVYSVSTYFFGRGMVHRPVFVRPTCSAHFHTSDDKIRYAIFNSLRPSSHPRQPATFDLSHFRAEPFAGSARRMLCDVHLRG